MNRRCKHSPTLLVRRTLASLQSITSTDDDPEAEHGLSRAETIEQVQDIHDYIQFRYHSQST